MPMQALNYDIVRARAITALDEIINQEKFSNDVVNTVLLNTSYTDLDKRFLVALIYGTLERLPLIDYWILQLSDMDFGKIDKMILLILRTALWQIQFADKVPPFAAVNEAVKLTGYFQRNHFAAYVNAVLRNFLRHPPKLPKKREHLKYGLTAELFGLYKKWYGVGQAEKILNQSFNLAKDLSVLYLAEEKDNWLKKLSDQGINVKAGILSEDAYYLQNFSDNISNIPGFQEGQIYIQNESAMLIGKMIHLLLSNRQKPLNVLDACAGLGGKSIALRRAEAALNITALEPDQNRFRALKENLKRLHLKNIAALNMDLQTFRLCQQHNLKFDFVLLDVPCSGLGIIRHKPEIKLKLTYEKIMKFPEIQTELLEESADLVKAGGILCYSTCTINPDENQNLIREFLHSRQGVQYEKINLKQILPFVKQDGKELLESFIIDSDIRIIPGICHLDGFYISALRKR